jgi:hypothetical protein
MPFPLRSYTCSKCDFEQPFNHENVSFYYTTTKGSKIKAPIGPGWCLDCDKIVLLQYGLSSSDLKREIDLLDRILEKQNKSFFQYLSKTKMDEIKKNRLQVIEKKEYISVLKGKCSVNSCLDCSSLKVFQLPRKVADYNFPDISSLTHINCGGKLIENVEYSSIHVFLSDVYIEPVFISDSNSIKTKNDENLDTNKNLSTNNIPNYTFITEVIKKLLDFERHVLINQKDKLHGFQCEKLIHSPYSRQFLIERFIFIYSFLKFEKWYMDLELMKSYISQVATKTYMISNQDAFKFVETRIDFYKRELEQLIKRKHPQPGKIIWSLYNPSCRKMSSEIDVDIEENLLACSYLIQCILGTVEVEIKKNGYNRN